MTNPTETTLRLLFPQWQGGNNPPYRFGTELLSWLAPAATGPTERVTVPEFDGTPLEVEDGITGRGALLAQLREARQLIEKHQPDRLVVLGGDCLVDLAPFAYLNERYDGRLAVLWVDAHSDLMMHKGYPNAHAMVLGSLLGEGDAEFAGEVRRPLQPRNVMFAGLVEPSPPETAMIEQLDLRKAGPAELAATSKPVLDWLKSIDATHLAIHFDLDVLDPSAFRSLMFANPNLPVDTFDGVPQGKMTMDQVIRLLADVAQVVDVVGLGVTEHLPWDALAVKAMLEKLPLIGAVSSKVPVQSSVEAVETTGGPD